MLRPSSLGLYGLSFLPVIWAARLPSELNAPSARDPFQPDLPDPTPAVNAEILELQRRDGASSSDSTTSSFLTPVPSSTAFPPYTSWVPASVCGYVDGILDPASSIECINNAQCVFHTPQPNYPGMVGCCTEPNPQQCRFESTCYDVGDISATPALTNNPDYFFGVYCTQYGSSACVTWTYPELRITDYGCGNARTFQAVYLTATSINEEHYGSTTAPYNVFYTTIGAVKPSFVDDRFIDSYISGTVGTSAPVDRGTPTASSSGQTPATTGSSSQSGGNSANNGSSSSSTPAIAGGVVGGVVGLAGLAAAAWMVVLLKRKKKQQGQDESSQSTSGGDPKHPNMGRPPVEVEGNAFHQYAAIDTYAAGQKFPSERLQEMDSKAHISELPAHQDYEGAVPAGDEIRPVSYHTSLSGRTY